MKPPSFGKELKAMRDKLGISQETAARRLGLSSNYIARLERSDDDRHPSEALRRALKTLPLLVAKQTPEPCQIGQKLFFGNVRDLKTHIDHCEQCLTVAEFLSRLTD